jgi:glutaconate CoA-transferase subunit A
VSELVALRDAVASHIHDGDTVALEGFTHLIPFAAGHEIIRQGRRDLTLVRMTPDVIYDQLIGAGVATAMVFSWGGNPGVGSLHRFRDAVEHGWPIPLGIEEHSNAGMAARYVAGASGLPFATLRGYRGTDLSARASSVAPITCPFTGEQLTAVAALRPDVAVIHAQQVDAEGNVGLWGIQGVQKEAVLASRRSIVTVEERVRTLDSRASVVLPSWVVSAVCVVPRGSHPSYSHSYSDRDNAFYQAWDQLSRDRDVFNDWIRRHVLETDTFEEHLALLDADAAKDGAA